MANYHFETKVISRGKGQSVTGSVSYITGQTLRDSYTGKTYYHYRKDVAWQEIFLPCLAPLEFQNLQCLCDAIERAEVRWDARTARQFIGSLPNELPLGEQARIVHGFIQDNFLCHKLCVVAAIHTGYNRSAPEKSNPHVHIIVSTRAVDLDGFSRKKDREHNKREFVAIWREQWAQVQNQVYERNGLDIRVSHLSLEVQGNRKREKSIYLSRIDWKREQRGIQTPAGDRKRAILEREISERSKRDREREQELELSR